MYDGSLISIILGSQRTEYAFTSNSISDMKKNHTDPAKQTKTDQTFKSSGTGDSFAETMGVFSADRLLAYLENRLSESTKLSFKLYEAAIDAFRQMPVDSPVITYLELAAQTLFTGDDRREDRARVLLAPFNKDQIYFNWCGFKHKDNLSLIRQLEAIIRDMLVLDTPFRELVAYRCLWQHYLEVACPINPTKTVEIIADDGRSFYFRICSDDRFADAQADLGDQAGKDVLEAADEASADQSQLLAALKETVPLENIKLYGFFTWEITDITVDHILRSVTQQAVVDEARSHSIPGSESMMLALGALTGLRELRYGFYPMLRINGRYLFNDPRRREKSLNADLVGNEQREELYDFLGNVFRHQTDVIYLRSITERSWKYGYLKALEQRGIRSYALLPVKYMGEFVGALEIFTAIPEALQKMTLFQLESFLPVLGLLYKRSVDQFNESLERIIKEEFTSLQPAVQWRFHEAALNFLAQNGTQSEPEEITFDQVYPLYGAVDVRNSTVNRNAALLADCLRQLDAMVSVMEPALSQTGFGLLAEKIFLCKEWKERVQADEDTLHSGELTYFLEKDMISFLHGFLDAYPECSKTVGSLMEEFNKAQDSVFSENRRKLERSMAAVIGSVNRNIDQLRSTALQHYPCFFEKFRTDGVEYDIYIGQSISPYQPFNTLYLKNLRLWQLTGMASIAKITHGLVPGLSKPLHTTQLIFVHSNSIDISFRNDERRFDVEGGYNIRYQVIKKRIDKVNIKQTGERLTQPGKIAIVYFNKKEADEYVEYINYLQGKGILQPGIEYLDLEELQGVSGLKALRVDVVL